MGFFVKILTAKDTKDALPRRSWTKAGKVFRKSVRGFRVVRSKLPRRAGEKGGDKKINFNAETPDAGHEFYELTRMVLTQRREDAKGWLVPTKSDEGGKPERK